MMSFLLFLIVLMISYNNGTARPMIDGDLTLVTGNRVYGYDSEEMRYKIPTIIKQGTLIYVKGTLDTTADMFKVVLINSDQNQENCNILLDLKNEKLTVTPAIKDDDQDDETYSLNSQPGVESKFVLKLIARENNGDKQLLGVTFQVNDEGESPQQICDINYENINYIEMQEGVAHVDSLLFKFKENR